jgi:hypothetical protein
MLSKSEASSKTGTAVLNPSVKARTWPGRIAYDVLRRRIPCQGDVLLIATKMLRVVEENRQRTKRNELVLNAIAAKLGIDSDSLLLRRVPAQKAG